MQNVSELPKIRETFAIRGLSLWCKDVPIAEGLSILPHSPARRKSNTASNIKALIPVLEAVTIE